MLATTLGFVIFVVIATLLLSHGVRRSVDSLGSATFEPLAECNPVLAPLRMMTHQTDAWARMQGFDFVGSYICRTTPTGLVAAWEHRDRPSYLCIYFIGSETAIDFVTKFSNNWNLTTAS